MTLDEWQAEIIQPAIDRVFDIINRRATMRPKVYLAGPIAGLTYDEGQDWRSYAQAVLDGAYIDGFSPLRGKDFLRAAGKIGTAGFAHALASDKGIMRRDSNDVKTSNAILVNFVGATKVSRGTDMELSMAYLLDIPVVVACPEDSIMLDHPMVRATIDYRVDTLDEALEIIKTIVLAGPRVPSAWVRSEPASAEQNQALNTRSVSPVTNGSVLDRSFSSNRRDNIGQSALRSGG